ncbi:MAG: pyruvate kinase [Acidimicrobiaceae bacterium]|nr:pyruvate kinase [Acidimicrobiaceae bacterium]
MLKRRRTKIVATLGPSSSDAATIEKLIAAGVNVVRLNMSHGDHEAHAQAYKELRTAAHNARNPIGVLVDLCGPKLRVGRFEGGGIDLVEGASVVVTTREVVGEAGLIASQYATLNEEIEAGARILLDDGALELRVDGVAGTEVTCTVVRGGRLKDRKGMNLPGSRLATPALTPKDIDDARFAIDLGADYLALSFVRKAQDVEDLKALLPADEPPRIIAKIEHPDALDNIDAIIDAADGIMVARGDLGVELPPEEVPVIQRRLVALARAHSKPCIVATQMLESMIEHAQPTRAEVSDVSTAVFSSADAVMLSAETASGSYPVEAVAMMDRIARQVEAHVFAERRFRAEGGDPVPAAGSSPVAEAVGVAVAQLSRDLRCRAIVVVSLGGTGATARVMSAARPGAPIVGAAATLRGMLQQSLLWGVVPRLVQAAEIEEPEELAKRVAGQLDLAGAGDRILLVKGFEQSPSITVLEV